MTRYAKARDANERDIVAALLAAGWTVERIEPVGRNNGTPDLVIGKHGVTTLAEVKRPAGPRGGTKDKRLTPKQEEWHDGWRGARPLLLDATEPADNVERAERWLATALAHAEPRTA
jgi:hypothetical protein